MTLLNISVVQSSDDAEEISSPAAPNITSSDLDFYGAADEWVGCRFQNVTIPAGSTINSVVVRFTARNNRTDCDDVDIFCQDVDDAPTFTVAVGNLSGRALTTATSFWAIPNTTGGVTFDSADFTTALQEVIDRGGWASGQDIAVIFQGTAFNSQSADAWSFDHGSNVPQIRIDYTAGSSSSSSSSTTTSSSSSTSVSSESFSTSTTTSSSSSSTSTISSSSSSSSSTSTSTSSSSSSISLPPPLFVRGSHQSRELTLVVRRPLWTDNGLISDSLRVDGLRVIWTAQGGFWSLSFNLRGRQSEVEDWIENGLGRQIQLFNPGLALIWDGFASKISGNIGGLSIARGPLIETVANKIQVAYSTVDYDITPPAVGVRDNTDWAEDTDSQDKYGIIERVVSLSGSTLTGAEQVRDTLLGEMAEPVSDETDNIGSASETSVTVECLGWVHWLNAYTYYSTTPGGTIASTKTKLVLGADPNGIFNTDYSQIATNTTEVGHWDNDYRVAWDVIKGIVSLGDASLNRYLFGVYADRRAKYNALPTAPKYQRALADPGQWLELFGSGGHVDPWDIEPGEWVFYTDLLVGKSQATNLRIDPRYLLVEQAQFSAPWSLSLQGGKSARLDQLLAQMGLGGSGG